MVEEEQHVDEDVGETAEEETDDVGPVVGAVAAAVAQEAETEAEPLAPLVEDDEDEEVVPMEAEDFQGCVEDGHQPGPDPGPGPGPEPSPPGPFCSDILSCSYVLRCCSCTTLLTRLGSSRSSQDRTAS
ncbi:hypothetical protein KPH14_006486 [Odynerus spinipes]|uniref:Uncharacterized protein n=1 Tax=Odynerus spinipes TaxID=1348599 RepID=A0AAD9RQG9_9HYME|nr:hypothetical protein KPH14_006486 [Odynerus spinipes]